MTERTTERTPERCPGAGTLAAFAEGKLPRREMPSVLAHLDTCERCRLAVEHTARLHDEPVSRRALSRRVMWLGAAAAAVVVIVSILAIRPLLDRNARPQSGLERLIELSPRSARVVEPRLSGAFAWAPYEGPLRATEAASNPQRLKLAGAAGEIVEQADRDRSAAAEHAAGIAFVLIEQPVQAVTRLRAATERSPSDARAWSDLAAAQYAAAAQLQRPSLYPEALASADRALGLDADLPAARFNRALVLERLGLTDAARDAWEAYLRVDGSSAWAVEARARLGRLRPATSEMNFKTDQPRLERAALTGDRLAVESLVRQYSQQSRAYAEVETLGRWAEAHQRGDDAAARAQLTIARGIGAAVAGLSGESLLRDAVHAIDAGDGRTRRDAAAAHVLYRRGRIAYSRRRLSDAEDDLRRAASMFATAGNPMQYVAAYYAACTRFDQSDVAAAREDLQSLLAAADARSQYIALGAQIRWELALCHIMNDEWTLVLPLAREATASFRRLNESSNLAVMQTILADTLVFLGRPDEAWETRIGTLRILSAEGRGDRLPVGIAEAARMELRVGRFEEARALLRIEEAAVRELDDDLLVADTLARKAKLNALLLDDRSALQDARAAAAAAHRIPDAAMREAYTVEAEVAEAAASLGSDPRRAAALLTTAIDHYRGSGKSFYLPESLLLRARARLRTGDAAGARLDLDSGIAEVEQRRSPLAGAAAGTGVLDAANTLYEDAIRLRLDGGDPAGAFLYAERWRARLATGRPLSTVEELQRRLAGSGAVVLELVALPGELLAFCVTEEQLTVQRAPVTRERLDVLGAAAGDDSAGQLYEILIRPSERALSGARHMIIVADPALERVPFAALYDSVTRQRLVERIPLQLAPSASALRNLPYGTTRSIVALALPSGEGSGSAGLPAVRTELEDAVRHYGQHRTIEPGAASFPAFVDAAARADVIHIAGHTERQPGLGDAALLFASANGRPAEPVSWRGIAAQPPMRARVIVLAACETLRSPRSAQARAMSLGGAFLSAGAVDVIGTLEPVSDEQSRAIFSAIHRHLGEGRDAAQSVRAAQLEALAVERSQRRRTGWRSVALLTTRIPPRDEQKGAETWARST